MGSHIGLGIPLPSIVIINKKKAFHFNRKNSLKNHTKHIGELYQTVAYRQDLVSLVELLYCIQSDGRAQIDVAFEQCR